MFVILILFPDWCPEEILRVRRFSLAVDRSPLTSHLSLTPGRPSDRKMLSAILACIARSLAAAD